MQKQNLINFPTIMPPKSTTDKLAKARARQAVMECKIWEAQAEADWEVEEVGKELERIEKEKQDVVHKCDEEALRAKKCHEEEVEWKQKFAANTRIMKYMAAVKARVPPGESIGVWDLDSDIGSGVSLVGVTDLVSKDFLLLSFNADWLVKTPEGDVVPCHMHQAFQGVQAAQARVLLAIAERSAACQWCRGGSNG